jgi:hypothetical protein
MRPSWRIGSWTSLRTRRDRTSSCCAPRN